MTGVVAKSDIVVEWTNEQRDIIKNTVAKDATPDELKLFLYRCRSMGLDPLKPGEVHFVKYGSAPGTMIVGVEGFRKRAARTGQHDGTERGVIRDAKGNCIGAWAQVYRKDKSRAFRDEVSLVEYSTHKNLWQKMPETMIKKVAEVATLRLAFPDELAGIYSSEEMDQAKDIAPDNHAARTSDNAYAARLNAIGAAQAKYNWKNSQVREYCVREFQAETSVQLSQTQVEQLIQYMEKNPMEQKPVV